MQFLHSRQLKQWINPKYVDSHLVQQLREKFSHQQPFSYLELPEFFNGEKLQEIRQALGKEQFPVKEADLFKFRQTGDFKFTKNKVLLRFREFLSSSEFGKYLSFITSTELDENTIDMFGTLYQDTDFLLCHDDQLEGRKIAYFLYLSDLEESDGGSLNLFSSKNGVPYKVAIKIIPKYNTLAFFHVSDKSFHEVAEVLTDTPRITITGWFYG